MEDISVVKTSPHSYSSLKSLPLALMLIKSSNQEKTTRPHKNGKKFWNKDSTAMTSAWQVHKASHTTAKNLLIQWPVSFSSDLVLANFALNPVLEAHETQSITNQICAYTGTRAFGTTVGTKIWLFERRYIFVIESRPVKGIKFGLWLPRIRIRIARIAAPSLDPLADPHLQNCS